MLTKSHISAPMGATGSSSAKEVGAEEEFDIQRPSVVNAAATKRTKRQISRAESRDQRSAAAEVRPEHESGSPTEINQAWEHILVEKCRSISTDLPVLSALKHDNKCLIKLQIATKWSYVGGVHFVTKI